MRRALEGKGPETNRRGLDQLCSEMRWSGVEAVLIGRDAKRSGKKEQREEMTWT